VRARPIERRVLGLVDEARFAIGDYGTRPLKEAAITTLMEVFNVVASTEDLSGFPAILFPPIAGKYRLVMDRSLPISVRRYITLHELGHVLAGEADEPTLMVHEGPLPESEDVCDLFALLGVLDEAHILEGGNWLEQQIRAAVPLDDYGWQTYRIPRLAKRLPRVREMVRDLHGYF
jgi:hypothetical protein